MANEKRAIVIGTGFGGAITSCRLAQAGFDVTVLERGRDYRQNRLQAGHPQAYPFPRNGAGLEDWAWLPSLKWHGLLDTNLVSQMQYVQAAGLGGGSLIYANVHLRMPPDGFATGWPNGYSRAALDPYYDLVAYMLDVMPLPTANQPPKTTAFLEAIGQLQRTAHAFQPALAINFGPRQQEVENRFGIKQEGCRYCGECIVGCPHRAKNTLDLNYLAVAEARQAKIHTECQVRHIEKVGSNYRVTWTNHRENREETLEAPYVFVCAGAVNSTELLLRCRDEYGTLPHLGAGLGTRYSGNGDYLAFAANTKKSLKPWEGPSITTAMHVDVREGDKRSWFLVEDGGHPEFWKQYLRVINPNLDLLRPLGNPLRILCSKLSSLLRHLGAKVETVAGENDDNLAVYLFMGRDQARGRIKLSWWKKKLKITWDTASNQHLYEMQQRIAADLAKQTGGTATLNPFWRFFGVPITVHNLGGCPMGTTPDNSVVNDLGEVHNYPGLFVLDGGILPESTGVNPSATIGAVVERNIEAFIRRTNGDPNWIAPEAEAARAARPVDPMATAVSAAEHGTPLPTTPPDAGFSGWWRRFVVWLRWSFLR